MYSDDLPHAPGNPIIAYKCDEPPAWNELWTVPAAGATGLVKATKGYNNTVSTLCAAVVPIVGGGWTLPWLPAWELKNY